MQAINWKATEEKARKMNANELIFAISDCAATATAMGRGPMMGKDSGYYFDEMSVYHTELKRRGIGGSR